jgi:hypothetical protein
LPTERFEFCEWKQPRVNIDYHVEVDRHYYSVPNALVGELVDARFTASTVELLHRGKRVASHVRSFVPGKHTTNPEHMPKSHQKHVESLGDATAPPTRRELRDTCRLRNATLIDTLASLQADGRVRIEAGHVQLTVG